jgi:hypothetical protein
MLKSIIAAALILGSTAPSYAKHHHHHQHHHYQHHRIEHHRVEVAKTVVAPEWPGFSLTPLFRMPLQAAGMAIHAVHGITSTLLPHPANCPHVAFCGCGAADEVGRSNDRSLWLARSWYRFPRAAPRPGMAAVAPHHVFVLKEHIEGAVWLVVDHNSGHHISRIHPRSIRGYTIVNPG